MKPGWNILAEGPSVLSCRTTDLLDGPVLAINRAVGALWSTELPKPAYWCAWDRPEAVITPAPDYGWPGIKAEDVPGVQIWCQPYWAAQWRELFPAHDICWIGPALREDFPIKDPCKHWDGYRTINVAIGESVYRGGRFIRLFGVDMEGARGAFCSFPEPNPDLRWRLEKMHLRFIVDEAAQNGIEIERWRDGKAAPWSWA